MEIEDERDADWICTAVGDIDYDDATGGACYCYGARGGEHVSSVGYVMRHLILAVVLTMMVTSNAWANNCKMLPVVWRATPYVVIMSVEKGFEKMYADSPVPHDAVTDAMHACMLSKVEFFIESIIMHCNMGFGDQAEQTAFNATLNLCAKEMGYATD